MDIHKPKPVHSWREFFSEISVVVCGILIALALEQGLEALHEAHVEDQSRRDVRAEAAVNLALMKDRAEEAPCIAKRLDQIEAILTPTRTASPDIKPIWVGRPVDVPTFVERWRSVTSSGRTALFSPNEQKALDNLFAVFGEFREEELREQAAWTELKLLERWNAPLDPAARWALLAAAETARHEDFEVRRGIFYGLGLAEALKITPDPLYGGVKGAPHSVCIPLDTPLDKARAMQRDRVPNPDEGSSGTVDRSPP
jgi:hypothetical protein